MKKLIIAAGVSFLWSSPSISQGYSIPGVRMVSRANCASFNESLSYSPTGQSLWFETRSLQRNETGAFRGFYSYRSHTWRSYAGCNGCTGGNVWTIAGDHWIFASSNDSLEAISHCPDYQGFGSPAPNERVLCASTFAQDCELSEGWPWS